MGSLGKSVLVGTAFAMLAAPVLAADLPPIIEPPVTPPIEDYSGWYIRGDIGYKIYNDPDVSFANGAVHLGDEEFDDTWMVGAGVGYQFNKYFRADVTVDYEFEADFTSETPCAAVGCGVVGYGGSTTVDETSMSVWTFLINGYVDLAHYYGFTPYVGAGVGFAYIDIDELVETAGTGNPPIPGASEWTFAAAAMAGVSYDVTEFLKIDANYRYLWLGDVEGDSNAAGQRLEYDNLSAHEFRVGLRYQVY